MLKEHIEFSKGLHIKTFIQSIDEYPIHMHDIIELIYVIEGEIELKVSFNNFTLKAGEIIAINEYDLHSIKKKSQFNLILFIEE